MKKERQFIKDWLAATFEPGVITRIDWQNDSRCTIRDIAGDTMRVWFWGRQLMADTRPVARMASPRELIGR
jgi:hypothetical protein